MNDKLKAGILTGIVLILVAINCVFIWLIKNEQQTKGNQKNQSNLTNQNQPANSEHNNLSTEKTSPSPTSASVNTTCDNYQCLISAAAQCQPVVANISYKDMPFPLNPDMSVSGQTNYEIKKAANTNDCILTFSSPVTILSISDSGRKAAIAKGTTDAQVTSLLKTMNDSAKSTAELQSTCPGNASTISDYLMDARDGNSKVESDGQTNTYTTSSGQKLACTTIAGQQANTSVTMTMMQCIAKKGAGKAVNAGTSCLKNEVDLGTITDSTVNGKHPQCCVSE